ncbi:MAG TPA: nuclear transport factor 2 family protein [Pyrinomonadaceae bacterium]|nr:nuclear transport factor 2 family protein [Pyrinomonadaceae bacterium]
MKRCSTCNRTYTDPNLSFCIDDGTPLTPVAADDETTAVSPRGKEDDEWNAVAYRPPSAYVPPGTPVKPRRRVWPWVAGIAGAFILGLLAISVAALIMVPRLRSRQNERRQVPVNKPANSNTAENRNTNTATPASNANSNSTADSPPPANHDQVLAHLKDLENEWMVANVNADKKKLELILADDYVGQSGPDGALETKAEYLQRTERDTQLQKWEMSEEKLTLTGDRATLGGIVTFFLLDGRVGSFDFKDKFVWREGRWQATGSELTPRRAPKGTDL